MSSLAPGRRARASAAAPLVALLVFALHSAAHADTVLPAGYSLDAPGFDHENIAIRLDAAGRAEESHRSFEASARFSDGVTALDNLGVSHMRRREWIDAAQSFGRALRRHSSTQNLQANIQVFKQMLEQHRVAQHTRQQCLDILEQAASGAARWASPAAIHAGKRVAPDEAIAPFRVHVANRVAFWKYLRSARFVDVYWCVKRPTPP
eukprot:3536420-Prymnesium_polylepis.1